jgi:hypothetical protein
MESFALGSSVCNTLRIAQVPVPPSRDVTSENWNSFCANRFFYWIHGILLEFPELEAFA